MIQVTVYRDTADVVGYSDGSARGILHSLLHQAGCKPVVKHDMLALYESPTGNYIEVRETGEA